MILERGIRQSLRQQGRGGQADGIHRHNGAERPAGGEHQLYPRDTDAAHAHHSQDGRRQRDADDQMLWATPLTAIW